MKQSNIKKRFIRSALIVIMIFILFILSCQKVKPKLMDGRTVSQFPEETTSMGYVDLLFDYEGYLDLVDVLQGEFVHRDFDGDGQEDRVLQYFLQDGRKMYAIIFGSGELLEIGPFESAWIGISILTEDFNADGMKDIVYIGQDMGSDYPESGSKIAVFMSENGTYKNVEWTEKQTTEIRFPVSCKKTDHKYEVNISSRCLNFEEFYTIPVDERKVYDSSFVEYGEDTSKEENMAWRADVRDQKLILYEKLFYRLPEELQIELEWSDDRFLVHNVKLISQKKQEERASASRVIINWENEVQFFDTDTPELTGIVQDINALAWIAPRGGAGINTEGIEQVQEENGYIVESSRYLEQYDEIIDTEGYDTWIRVVQKQVRSETGTTETGHGDYLIYRQGDNGYLAVQSEMDSASWTVWELPGYGEWLDKEVAMFIRMVTGL